jgi:hypothetical protein
MEEDKKVNHILVSKDSVFAIYVNDEEVVAYLEEMKNFDLPDILIPISDIEKALESPYLPIRNTITKKERG